MTTAASSELSASSHFAGAVPPVHSLQELVQGHIVQEEEETLKKGRDLVRPKQEEEESLEDRISAFAAQIVELIDADKSDEALAEVLDDANEILVHWACMDLFGALGAKMYDGALHRKSQDAWDHCESILEYLTKFCKPKEVLLALLEFAERVESDVCFFLVVPLLKIAFIRSPSKRGRNIIWGLHVIYRYIKALPVPETQEIEEEEEAILENSPVHGRLERCMLLCLDFCGPFVSEAKSCSLVSTEDRVSQVQQLLSFLLKLLERPFAYFQVSFGKEYLKSFECVERLIIQVLDLCPNPFPQICDWQSRGILSLTCDAVPDCDSSTSKTAIGVLAYFMFCQSFFLGNLPCVYTEEYIFELILPSCVALLRQSYKNPVLKKGVLLAGTLLERCSNLPRWGKDRLSQLDYQEFFLGLVNAMSTSADANTRQKGLLAFRSYLERFSVSGQIGGLKLIFSRVGASPDGEWIFPNNGICGWMIDWYRGKLVFQMRNPDAFSSSNTPRYSDHLPELLDLFCHLKDQETTDLLDNFEQYMAALNMIRFLCIVVHNRKLLFSKQILLRHQDSFVNVLHRGIQLSVGHFKLEIKNEKQNKMSSGAKNQSEPMMMAALNSFDLMESLIGRVSELLNGLVKD